MPLRAREETLGERAVVDLTCVLGFYGMVSMALSLGEVLGGRRSAPLAPGRSLRVNLVRWGAPSPGAP